MKKTRYQSLTIKRKLEIIERVEHLPPHKKKKDIAAEFGIPQSTLSTILKNKDSLQANDVAGGKKKKRVRTPTKLDVDVALFQWFSAARAQSIPISGEILKAKAEELSEGFDPGSNWTCSSGWLSRWKVRHHIKCRIICGENAAVDKDACEDWRKRKLVSYLRRYDPKDIFNADETGLYWRLLTDKTHSLSGEVCIGGKKSKERVIVLVCANMTGTEKLSLVTIGKFKKPRCFRGISCLPTEYEASPKAWMTSRIFETWLRKWDARLTHVKRKIALFVDNCTAHPHIENLKSIDLVFLPPNTTSEVQPCDQGIIKTMKTHYRKNMVHRLIAAIDGGLTVNTFKITLLDALQILKKAWDSVTSTCISTCIANCFRKGGFVVSDDSTQADEDEEDPFHDLDKSTEEPQEDTFEGLQMEGVSCTFEEYVCVDDHLQCAPSPTTEDIIASVRQTSEEAEGWRSIATCDISASSICLRRISDISVAIS